MVLGSAGILTTGVGRRSSHRHPQQIVRLPLFIHRVAGKAHSRKPTVATSTKTGRLNHSLYYTRGLRNPSPRGSVKDVIGSPITIRQLLLRASGILHSRKLGGLPPKQKALLRERR